MTYPQNFTTPEQKEQFDKLFEFCKSLPAKYKFQYLATEKYSDTYSFTLAVFDVPDTARHNSQLQPAKITGEVDRLILNYCDDNKVFWCEPCPLAQFKRYQKYPDSEIKIEDWIINS